MASISIPMPKLMKQVTLHMVVTDAGRTRLRLWLGTKLLRFAGAVIGCGVEIVSKPDRPDPVPDAPPRALSSDATDPRFVALVGHLQVYLDGVPQAMASAYDLDAGTVTRAKLDEAGKIIVSAGSVIEETVRGLVTIGLSPTAAHV